MKAVCWYGTNNLQVRNVSDPSILNPRDAIIRVKLSSVCGSDLHLLDGFVPTMRDGDIIGHEFMGEVEEVGPAVTNLRRGDRVVVPSVIACGGCYYCDHDLWSLCDNSNPHAAIGETMYGHAGAGIYGYSHGFGGYAGSHAEYIRVPFADVGVFKLPDEVDDDQAVFISDAFPTGFQAAYFGDIKPGSTVAVWGCGAVGLFAMRSAYMLGAGRVIAIDKFPERLEAARRFGMAETLDYTDGETVSRLNEMTGGRGPDTCIDAVGMEADTIGFARTYDKVKQTLRLEQDRPHVLREAIQACRKGGTVSIVGVYAGLVDKMPMGAAFNKGLTLRMGQMHAHRYIPGLIDRVAKDEIDPSQLITHVMSLEQAPEGYQMFKKKREGMIRAVFAPHGRPDGASRSPGGVPRE